MTSGLQWIGALAALVLWAAALPVSAHGDEPHGDAPHPAGPPAVPRFEAATEAFELVARLESGALTLFINRFRTSEPVLEAKVELESGEQQAVATYQSAQGSYVVSDPAFVQALARPGSHPVVVTVTAGQEADLLEGTLGIAAPAAAAQSGALRVPLAVGGTALLLLATVAVVLGRRRARRRRQS